MPAGGWLRGFGTSPWQAAASRAESSSRLARPDRRTTNNRRQTFPCRKAGNRPFLPVPFVPEVSRAGCSLWKIRNLWNPSAWHGVCYDNRYAFNLPDLMSATATLTKPARPITVNAVLPQTSLRAAFTQKGDTLVYPFNVTAGLPLTASICTAGDRPTPVFVSVPLDTDPKPFHGRHYGTGRLWGRQARLAAQRALNRAA